MSVLKDSFKFIKSIVIINEKINNLTNNHVQSLKDIKDINERLIRIEAFFEIMKENRKTKRIE